MFTGLPLILVAILVSGAAYGQDDDPPFPIEAGMRAWGTAIHSGDPKINLINPGSNGASLNGPGFGTPSGNICANIYAFSPDEQLISCCSCLITPNGLASLSVTTDLLGNTLRGIRPNSVVVKLIATIAGTGGTGTSCTNSAALAGTPAFKITNTGLVAWGVGIHVAPVTGTFAITEVPFGTATLSKAERDSVTNRCANIIGNGSTFGICRSCRVGGLNATQ